MVPADYGAPTTEPAGSVQDPPATRQLPITPQPPTGTALRIETADHGCTVAEFESRRDEIAQEHLKTATSQG